MGFHVSFRECKIVKTSTLYRGFTRGQAREITFHMFGGGGGGWGGAGVGT